MLKNTKFGQINVTNFSKLLRAETGKFLASTRVKLPAPTSKIIFKILDINSLDFGEVCKLGNVV